jgi:hypothetical protein
LKRGGFNNQPLFVDSTKVQNMLKLISVFSGANEGGPSALVDLTNDVSGILPVIHGGTGLGAAPAIDGYVLATDGYGGLSYQFVANLAVSTPFSNGVANASELVITDGYGLLDPSFYYKNPVYIQAAAGIFSNSNSTPSPIGAFTFRFDSFILEGLSTITLEAIIETTDPTGAASANIQLFSIGSYSYLALNGSNTTISTSKNYATLVRSQDLAALTNIQLLSGATDWVYEVQLNLTGGSGTETAICKMARLVITYNNPSTVPGNGTTHSYNFVPYRPNPNTVG